MNCSHEEIVNRTPLTFASALIVVLMALSLMSCRPSSPPGAHGEAGTAATEDTPRGPHGGRLFRDGDISLELAIHETGVPPRFRAWARDGESAVAPSQVTLHVDVRRLGDVVERFAFAPEADYLAADGIVGEPHSFDADVTATIGGGSHSWTFSQREGRISLPPESVASADVEILTAGPRRIASRLEMPGEIGINRDRVAHVVPTLAGVVREVRQGLGARVRRGEILAVLDSRELADARSAYLSAVKRLDLARTTAAREQHLFERRVSAEQDLLLAKQQLAEAEIEHDTAEQKLLALGISRDRLAASGSDSSTSLTRHELRAPLDGVVIERHLAIGEAVAADADVFVIADLSTLWCDVTIYAKDIGSVHAGQAVSVRSAELNLSADGTIAFVGDLVGEETRTARARVVLPNPDGQWRAGLFVTVAIVQDEVDVPVAVSRAGIQTFRDWNVVYQQFGDDFEVRPIELGRSDGEWVEVTEGLPPGALYAARNSFILKAELGKSGATHDH